MTPIKAESWENCAESFGICSGDAPEKLKLKAAARPTAIQATRVAARRSITELSKPGKVGAASQ